VLTDDEPCEVTVIVVVVENSEVMTKVVVTLTTMLFGEREPETYRVAKTRPAPANRPTTSKAPPVAKPDARLRKAA
jgi:hypothetical protein